MFKIGEPTDTIKAFRVSKDACIAALVTGNDEIHIYRLFDNKGEFLGDKKALMPVNKIKIRETQYTDVIDLQVQRRMDPNTQQVDYFLYLVSTNGVLLYSQIEKREDCKLLQDEWALYSLTPNCTDINTQGELLIDAALKQRDGEDPSQQKYYLKRYFLREQLGTDPLEGAKDKLRFFRDNQIVELKTIKSGAMQVSIYDFSNKLTVYCQSYP